MREKTRPAIVLLTEVSPCKLGDELEAAGYEVVEAVSASEVLALCQERKIMAVVVSPEVHDDALGPISQRYITLQLKPNAATSDAIWELFNLFPRCPSQ